MKLNRLSALLLFFVALLETEHERFSGKSSRRLDERG